MIGLTKMRFSWAPFVTQLPGFILRALLKGASAVNVGSGPRLGRQLAARGGQLCAQPRSAPLGRKVRFEFIYVFWKELFLDASISYISLWSGGRGDLKKQTRKNNLKGQFRTSPFLASPSARPWHLLP